MAACLGWGLDVLAAPELDCSRAEEARAQIGRLMLAEIEGAEDIHREAMWSAFGRCPAGSAGEPCRQAERRRFDAVWVREKQQIEARYRAMLSEFELRCRAQWSRARGQGGGGG